MKIPHTDNIRECYPVLATRPERPQIPVPTHVLERIYNEKTREWQTVSVPVDQLTTNKQRSVEMQRRNQGDQTTIADSYSRLTEDQQAEYQRLVARGNESEDQHVNRLFQISRAAGKNHHLTCPRQIAQLIQSPEAQTATGAGYTYAYKLLAALLWFEQHPNWSNLTEAEQKELIAEKHLVNA